MPEPSDDARYPASRACFDLCDDNHASAGSEPALCVLQGTGAFRSDQRRSRAVTRRAPGEWEVRGDAQGETRFPFRTGITSVVPWLVVP